MIRILLLGLRVVGFAAVKISHKQQDEDDCWEEEVSMVSQVCREEEEIECGVCHTMFMKECNINMELRNKPVKVNMCTSVPADNDCKNGYRRSCRTKYESVCGTRWEVEEMEEDRPVCGVHMVGKCPTDLQTGLPSPPSPSPNCTVVAPGPDTGATCIFPFTWPAKGKSYEECAFEPDMGDTYPWCSTQVDEGGNHVTGEGHWGKCDPINCTKNDTCVEVPVMKCRIEKKMVKKRMPKTACRRIPRQFCMKKKCKAKKTKCVPKIQMISELTPIESCGYSPQKVCQATEGSDKSCRTVKRQVCKPDQDSPPTVRRKRCKQTKTEPVQNEVALV